MSGLVMAVAKSVKKLTQPSAQMFLGANMIRLKHYSLLSDLRNSAISLCMLFNSWFVCACAWINSSNLLLVPKTAKGIKNHKMPATNKKIKKINPKKPENIPGILSSLH